MSARILVVDDIMPNVKLLEAKLSSEYYEVITAYNGPEALEKAEKESPDIILLDVMMPGMDGFEVCATLKKNPKLAHIPVVMVTALTDTQDKVRGLESGADDFLSKPINDTALMARVRSLVRLKMTLDEWRVRETTAEELGVWDESSQLMNQNTADSSILVIEDKDFEQDKIHESLDNLTTRLDIVGNGPDALNLLNEHHYDVIIVSLNLASEDGLRLCSHFKSNERSRSVPILMMAAEDDMGRIVQGLDMGAHDYILRPLDRSELLARVRTQIRRRRFQQRLRSTYEVSLSMALTDSLTGLHNRRYLETHLEKLIDKNTRSRKSLAVMLLDIDHFKTVNDTYGHNVGDQILQQFASRLKRALRSFDLVARYGGEEFVVILPDVSEERAHMVGDRIRRTIADTPFTCDIPEGHLNITTSIGGIIIRSRKHPVDSVLERADKCLYQAKNSGRNCTVFEREGLLKPESYAHKIRTQYDDNQTEDTPPSSSSSTS
jgi:two-component system cell cycle response regulator